jgi:hypothetical protein
VVEEVAVLDERDMMEVRRTAERMTQQYGKEGARDWASHFAANNHSPGEYGHAFWRAVADHISGEPLQPNAPTKRLRRRRTSRSPKRPVRPNRKARAIGDRPSMDTSFFGEDLDDDAIDAVSGATGKHLDAAMRRYKTFHDKPPIRIAELAHDLPTKWTEVGDALACMYRTDKWKKFGDDEDYKHLHDKGDNHPYARLKGVRLYHPSRSGRSLPVARPQAMTLLGYCLGVFVHKDDEADPEDDNAGIYESNPRGSYLFCSPSGDMLAIYSPHEQSNGKSGFLAALVGGNLRVLKDGIDG